MEVLDHLLQELLPQGKEAQDYASPGKEGPGSPGCKGGGGGGRSVLKKNEDNNNTANRSET